MGVHELEKEILQASLFFWAGVSWKCHCLTERAFVLWCGKAHANIRYRWGSYSQSRASVYVDVCHFCCNNHLAETKLVRKCSSKNSDLHESCGCTFAPGWESTQALSVLTGTHTQKWRFVFLQQKRSDPLQCICLYTWLAIPNYHNNHHHHVGSPIF